jgi:CHRD domain
MRRFFPILTTALFAATLAAGIATASNHVTTLSTTLSGAEEVGGGDKNGKGFVTLDIFANGTICWEGKVQAIERVTAAHIHNAVAGVNGGVFVDLDPFGADVTGNKAENCVVTTAANAAAIVANPSGYYVNVHTATFPGGAIRGQLGD